MKKRLVFFTIMLIVTLLLFGTVSAYAASVNLSVSGEGSYTKGSTVNITYTYKADSIGAATTDITYDSSVLQYVSCSGGVGPSSAAGVLSINAVNGQDSGSLSVTVTFKAIGTGSSNVSFSTSDIVDYNFNPLSGASKSTTVKVTNPAPNVSSNANLASLYISSGSLSPSFSSSITSYTVYVDEDVTVLTLSAYPEDDDAEITVAGSKNLSMGKNTRSVTVTAPSGNTKTYTLTIYRGDDSGNAGSDVDGDTDQDKDEDKKEPITVTIDEVDYEIQENIDAENVPKGFSLAVGKFDGKDIPLVKFSDNKYTLALLKNQESKEFKWFFYDEKTGEFSETVKLSTEDAMKFAELSTQTIIVEEPEEKPLFGDNEILLLLILGGTLGVLAIVIIVFQYKIVTGKKNKKKAKQHVVAEIKEEKAEE